MRNIKRGIDVSSYQGKIDWTKVKPYIDFAIIRCGWGNNTTSQDDIYYERNTSSCEELNIPYGVYLYSYATNLDEARSEVEHTLRLIKNKKIQYPIYLDVEYKEQMSLPKQDLIDIVKYYCHEIEAAGYYVGIYASLNSFKGILNSKELERYNKWIAEWNDELTYKEPVGMRQNTSYEELSGIKSRVDGDIAYKDYPTIIKDRNLNHLNSKKLKYNSGDKIYVSGNIYEASNATKIIDIVCDEEFTIESIINQAKAPYQIKEGYVEESSIYKKE